MQHNHNHSCTCDHERVRYCKHCFTVYCLDCNQEWTAKGYNGYWWYTQPSTLRWDWAIPMAGSGSGITQFSDNINIQNDGHTVTCSHNHEK